MKSRSLFLLLLITALAAAQAVAQPSSLKAPFETGETLTYDAKISKIIQGISVAELTFTVGSGAEEDNYLITAEARSKGTLVKLFRYSFLQKIDSVVRRSDMSSLRTAKHDVQKERIRNSEAVFDYNDRRVTYTETDPNEPMRPPRMIASDLSGGTYDLVSGIYYLRTLPLAVGKTFDITVSDSGLVYKVPVRVTGREQLKTEIGKVWCFKLEPEVFGEGRMIQREGSMTIWITEDARRLPVRSQVKSSFGKIEIKLKSVGTATAMAPKPSGKTE
jgi:Protein of unknown function (DUF3108).